MSEESQPHRIEKSIRLAERLAEFEHTLRRMEGRGLPAETVERQQASVDEAAEAVSRDLFAPELLNEARAKVASEKRRAAALESSFLGRLRGAATHLHVSGVGVFEPGGFFDDDEEAQQEWEHFVHALNAGDAEEILNRFLELLGMGLADLVHEELPLLHHYPEVIRLQRGRTQ